MRAMSAPTAGHMFMSSRTLPEYLKIGPYWYEVIEADESWEEMHGDGGISGLCLNRESRIYVNLTGNRTFDIDTFWHEVKHAIWFVFGLQDSDDEERVVSAMATGELMVLKDNPELFSMLMDYVTEEEEK